MIHLIHFLKKMYKKVYLGTSIILTALIVVVSLVGLFTPGFYGTETPNWRAQSVGQDFIDLFLIAPCLLITSILKYRGNKIAQMLWGGVVLYLTYTFAVYCFDVHFNKLFIIYCVILGLSFYSSIGFLLFQKKDNPEILFKKNAAATTTGIYFILIGVLFCILWLMDIVPAIIHNYTPKTLLDAGLATNPVHVLDLSVFLPAIFLTGVFLLRKNNMANTIAPSLLMFFVLMDITIGFLNIYMMGQGLPGEALVSLVMGILTFVSLAILMWLIWSIKKVPADLPGAP